MSRTKLIPEVFLDIFLYMRDSRECRESGLPIRGSLIQRKKKSRKTSATSLSLNLTSD